MTQTVTKTFKKPDGTVLHVLQPSGKNAILHSLEGPAIKYPKSLKKENEYYIYGRQYSKEKWLEAKNDSKVTYMPIDPNLG